MTGPAGFWCRHCGQYLSIRTKVAAKLAKAHTCAGQVAQ